MTELSAVVGVQALPARELLTKLLPFRRLALRTVESLALPVDSLILGVKSLILAIPDGGVVVEQRRQRPQRVVGSALGEGPHPILEGMEFLKVWDN